MKNKIKDALKQRYNNLGLSEEAFDGVAASVETIVTDESLEGFVTGAEPLLKQFQSIADKARSSKITELEAKLKELEGKKPPLTPPDHTFTLEDVTSKITEAIANAVKPLNEEIAGMKASAQAKESLAGVKASFFGGDYAKAYAEEASDAWERVEELNTALGNKMTAEELKTKVESYFNKAVAKKGVDTSKPFKSTKTDDTPNFEDDVKILQEAGVIAKDNK